MEAVLAKAMANLSDPSKTILEGYFHWSKLKRDRFIKDLDYQYKQYRETRVLDQTYNATEVEDVLQGLFLIVQASINQEASSQATAFAEYLRNVLLEADKKSVAIVVPPSAMDNIGAAQAMEALEQQVTAQPPKGRLAPLLQASDKTRELSEAQEEIKRLNEKVRKITELYSSATQEKSLLVTENSRLKEAALIPTSGAGGDVQAAQQQIRKLAQELTETKKELTVRLSSCTQFTNLKKMLAQKNQQVKSLRERLSKYEKDTEDDDTDVIIAD